jgi:hypothetical protein
VASGPGPSPPSCWTEMTFLHHSGSLRPSTVYSQVSSRGRSITIVLLTPSSDIAGQYPAIRGDGREPWAALSPTTDGFNEARGRPC